MLITDVTVKTDAVVKMKVGEKMEVGLKTVRSGTMRKINKRA